MGKDISTSLHDFVSRERPAPLGIVIANEGNGVFRQKSDHSRRPRLRVLHPPQLSLNGSLKNAFCGEIERRDNTAGSLYPVNLLISMPILVNV
ncbi:hypothetical protein Nepgr_004903 [Nepenthes gracilis]|uniref:Uncharacterized protein n=1 Tax=Nepenthes gracilis TaxID=150966 RepID=A0AAD3S2C2_NEPGR|nr:hypothetical protein Nepgr_004903 [Nepenthes gracilis]